MWMKILLLFMVSLFPFLSVGICEPGIYYRYIDPEVYDTQWDFNQNQVFLVKDKGVTICDIDAKLGSKNLNPNQAFMIIGEFVILISNDEEDLEGEEFLEDVYFKVALIKENGEINMSHIGWIYRGDFREMKINGKIEHIKGKVIFQRESKKELNETS